MKRFLLFIAMTAIFFGCEKMQPSGKSGIYVNEKLECELRSAFAGGGIANPSKGFSSRMHIYEEYYPEGPRWDEVKERVWIRGFFHNGKEYSDAGESIDEIMINGLPSIGDIRIPMNQGKYEGGNELVSSVNLVSYSKGNYHSETNRREDSQINIKIVLKDNRTIDIIYSGPIPYDGYY